MIGSTVNHPLFGRGQIIELRNAARESAVRFDNGIRAVVPVNLLSVLKSSDTPALAPRPLIAPRNETARTVEQEQRFAARRTIDQRLDLQKCSAVTRNGRRCEWSTGQTDYPSPRRAGPNRAG